MKQLLSLATVALLFCFGVAAAQTGTIAGMVVDDAGVAVEAARVSLHQDGQCVGYVLTGADGTYLIEDVAVGLYTVKAGKPQVGTATVEGVEVLEGQTVTVDFVLECAGGGGGGGTQHQHKKQLKHQHQYSGGE